MKKKHLVGLGILIIAIVVYWQLAVKNMQPINASLYETTTPQLEGDTIEIERTAGSDSSFTNDLLVTPFTRLGFEIALPKTVLVNKEPMQTSTVGFFDDGKNSVVYVAPRERLVASAVTGPVQPTTFSMLNQDTRLWRIVVAPARSEQELISFIHREFAPDCQIANKVEDQFGQLKIHLASDGSGTAGACAIPLEYMIKYSPKFGKVAGWYMGSQKDHFLNVVSPKLARAYDWTMADSFKFTQ